MYRFDWTDLVTGELLDKVRAAAGSDASDDALRPVLAAVLANTGGLPVAETEWSDRHRSGVGERLLSEALGSALGRVGHRRGGPGADVTGADAGDGPLTHRIVPAERVDINSADTETLVALPVLGTALAQQVVEVRRARGPFVGPSDLARRIDGIGESGSARLAGLVDFADPARETGPSGEDTDVESLLVHFLEHHAAAGGDVVGGLERLASITSSAPHPATRASRRRAELEPEAAGLPPLADAQAVELLEDRKYLPRLLEVIDEAGQRIDVAMFFMAYSNERHPNEQVVRKLEASRERGVAVRVLLDRDRPDDPYGSEIINSRAMARLREAGIDVRPDTRERLLHSKCVAVDGRKLIVGSHNWTRSSYATYRDVSVVLHAPELAAQWHQRFDELWAANPG